LGIKIVLGTQRVLTSHIPKEREESVRTKNGNQKNRVVLKKDLNT
jgi:hypothetical protein